jgi:curved DNA-binding protein CbpA
MPADETYYDILSVSKDASLQDITGAYRKLAKILHPDVCESPEAEELFKAVNEAYRILRDPEKRKEYDATLEAEQVLPQGKYYQGGRYRDPRTWYYSHTYTRAGRPKPGENIRAQRKKSAIPRIMQVLLFYLTLFMAVIILAQLFLMPLIEGVNARDARTAFTEGNRWIEEHEYQKAIESFQTATTRLPSFSEAWRAKGLTEVKKAEELSLLRRSDADEYYRSAIRSFSHLNPENIEDTAVIKSLAKAYFNTGERNKALIILRAAKDSHPWDNEISTLLQDINSGKFEQRSVIQPSA